MELISLFSTENNLPTPKDSPQKLVTKQTIQTRYIRLELLNYQLQIIGELNGVATGGNISIDSTSDIRRSGSIVMTVSKSTVKLGFNSSYWLDKYIRVYVGIQKLTNDKIIWNNCGLFIVDTPTYEYNATANTISLSLLDLMAKLTGVRNGYAMKTPIVLKAGEDIRQAMIATLALAGFTKYLIDDPPSPGVIPNDMEFGQGSTYHNVLVGLRDIYPNYEIFFDTDGTFVYRAIPTGKNAPVLVDDDIWKHITVSENSNVNLNNVKNAIEVFGRIHDPEYIASAENVIVDIGNPYINLEIPDVTSYTDDMIYGFEINREIGYRYFTLNINDLEILPVKNDDGTDAGIYTDKDNGIYCVQFISTYRFSYHGTNFIVNGQTSLINKVNQMYNKEFTTIDEIKAGLSGATITPISRYWRWMGHLQAHGYAEDNNPISPYYVNGPVGKIYLPLFSGDYSNCFTDDLAQQRAEYELYLHSNLQDNVTLQCVPVFWFDANMLVNYTSQRTGKANKYLIKSIDLGLDVQDLMSVTMMRYYPIS